MFLKINFYNIGLDQSSEFSISLAHYSPFFIKKRKKTSAVPKNMPSLSEHIESAPYLSSLAPTMPKAASGFLDHSNTYLCTVAVTITSIKGNKLG